MCALPTPPTLPGSGPTDYPPPPGVCSGHESFLAIVTFCYKTLCFKSPGMWSLGAGAQENKNLNH